MEVSYHIIFKGRVQGVFFRLFCKSIVNSFNKENEDKICGFVKNLSNGDVELVLQGLEKNIKKVFEKIKKGNNYCKIEKIELKRKKIEKKYDGFNIIRE